uniref:Sodium-coupled neutral amino acid transporter 9-like n=1 Tax=Hirondellea gigas TaxID=1518452 RepID=A0A2P2I9S2_9CRUS
MSNLGIRKEENSRNGSPNRVTFVNTDEEGEFQEDGVQKDRINEKAPLLPSNQGPASHTIRPATSALLVPDDTRQPPMKRVFSYGTQQLPGSWSNYFRPSPYTEENKPNRRPFHIPRVVSAGTSNVCSSGEGSGYNSAVEEGGLDGDTVPTRRISAPSSPTAGAHNRRINATEDPHTHLLTRYRYYSRLRAPAQPDDHALVIPDHVVPMHYLLPFIPGGFDVGPDGKQASYITIISVWNTMMGTSILTMPWAFGKAGFVGGLVVMIGMAILCLFTAYRILTMQKVAGIGGPLLEASNLCQEVIGGVWGRLVEGGAVVFSILTLLGALVVYWVLMSNFTYNTGMAIHNAIYSDAGEHNNSAALLCANNITGLVPENSSSLELLYEPFNSTTQSYGGGGVSAGGGDFDTYWNQTLTVPFYLLLVFVPILCIKNTRIFSYFNSMGAVSVLAIYMFVVGKAITWGLNYNFTDTSDPYYMPLITDEFMTLSGTLSLAYFIHNCIITIMKGNRNQHNNVRDLSIAFTLVMFTYVPIGVIFYSTFPLPKICIADNFLDNFPPHTVVLAIVRVFLLFQMLTVFPLLAVFLRIQLLCYCRGHATSSPHFLLDSAVNAVILICCVLVATLYPNVGFLIRWVGAIAGLVYVFLLPCGLYLKALYGKGELGFFTTFLHVTIMLMGVVNFIAQFFL